MREAGPRRWAALATAIGACAIPVAGCGGGDEGATTATGAAAEVPTVTAPAAPGAPADRNGSGGGPSSATATAPGQSPFLGPRAQQARRQLAPFIDCLSRHGVGPDAFRQALRQQYERGRPGRPDLGRFRSQVEAGIACIPSLPPRLRASAERLAQRYEQRNG